MSRSFIKILLVAGLAILYASCEDGEIGPHELPSVQWQVLPDKELSEIKQWHTSRLQELPEGTRSSTIMWGTARYSRVAKDQYIISALVADQSKLLKTAYFFKREDTYSAYILGHSVNNRVDVGGDFTGELALFDLEGNLKTSSILEGGRTILSKNDNWLKKGQSNFRVATEDEPTMLPEVVIEGTRIQSNTTWLLMSSIPYFDLSSTFPGYQYEGFYGGSHHYAAPIAQPQNAITFTGGPIINMPCVSSKFSDGKVPKKFTVTIYVDQPKPGTREKWAWNDNGDKMSAGHTFVGLKKENQDGTFVEYIVGYYPINNSVSPLTGDATDAGGFRNNNTSGYDVSISYTVMGEHFVAALNYLNSLNNTTYNLNTQNCSDVGVQCAAAMERMLPDTYGSWGTGGGTNPADLGEDIRAMPNSSGYTINRTGGKAQTSHTSGGC
jgi:hypothetical protein